MEMAEDGVYGVCGGGQGGHFVLRAWCFCFYVHGIC